VDEFPGVRFEMTGYFQNPILESVGWDGNAIFALNIDALNGFGEIYRYNMTSKRGEQVKPFANRCCFRDFAWSPDNSYILFVFQDNGFAKDSQIYYLPYPTLGFDSDPKPLLIPQELLSDPKTQPQPVLRPSQ
jgi:hypothetical protein